MDILIGVVTSSELGHNRDGEVAGRLLQAAISEPTDVQTVEMAQGGDEFHPPPGIRLVLVDAGDCLMAVGTDDGIPPAMDPGGRRIYSLDPTGMEVKAEVQLKPDGTAITRNDAGSVTISPDGTIVARNGAASFTMSKDGKFTFHGVSSTFDHPVTVNSTITATGTITAPTVVGSTDVTFAGKSAKDHKHAGVQTGPGQTGVPV